MPTGAAGPQASASDQRTLSPKLSVYGPHRLDQRSPWRAFVPHPLHQTVGPSTRPQVIPGRLPPGDPPWLPRPQSRGSDQTQLSFAPHEALLQPPACLPYRSCPAPTSRGSPVAPRWTAAAWPAEEWCRSSRGRSPSRPSQTAAPRKRLPRSSRCPRGQPRPPEPPHPSARIPASTAPAVANGQVPGTMPKGRNLRAPLHLASSHLLTPPLGPTLAALPLPGFPAHTRRPFRCIPGLASESRPLYRPDLVRRRHGGRHSRITRVRNVPCHRHIPARRRSAWVSPHRRAPTLLGRARHPASDNLAPPRGPRGCGIQPGSRQHLPRRGRRSYAGRPRVGMGGARVPGAGARVWRAEARRCGNRAVSSPQDQAPAPKRSGRGGGSGCGAFVLARHGRRGRGRVVPRHMRCMVRHVPNRLCTRNPRRRLPPAGSSARKGHAELRLVVGIPKPRKGQPAAWAGAWGKVPASFGGGTAHLAEDPRFGLVRALSPPAGIPGFVPACSTGFRDCPK